MRLDRLQLDLRPRPHPQALDLGMALLRANARNVYAAWLALWVPLFVIAALLDWRFSDTTLGLATLAAWWFRPLLERAPLFILSRQVFGEPVTPRDALRAWPGQLRGGWFRLLTWWRPFMPGRALYQPVWQLEGARGKVAAQRRAVIGAGGTARAAFGFGMACAHFELVLALGLFAFAGLFVSDEATMNPFVLFRGLAQENAAAMLALNLAYCAAVAVIGPVYVASGFALYLNRRATLEAWDLEIVLRQVRPPAPRAAAAGSGTLAALAAPLALALAALSWHGDASAAGSAATAAGPAAGARCAPPADIARYRTDSRRDRAPDAGEAQARLRRDLDALYDHEDLRGYECDTEWHRKNPARKERARDTGLPELAWLATLLKILVIAAGIGAAAWLLYRYRDHLPRLARRTPRQATEIAGLDIRRASLPGDVPGEVRRLWSAGDPRGALALLYRATLSRLADGGLVLTPGATEGDCLRAAGAAHAAGRLPDASLELTTAITGWWQAGAYGGRWPGSDALLAACGRWDRVFPTGGATAGGGR